MQATTDVESLRAHAAAILLEAFEACGDSRFKTAHGILMGNRAGRPSVDDTAALAVMAELIASGRARTTQQAARFAARATPGGQDEASAVRRLLTKYKNAVAAE